MAIGDAAQVDLRAPSPRSEVAPPLRRQCWIDGICGIWVIGNIVRKIG